MAQILIVDDEEEIRNLSSDILQTEGYSVDTAADGHEALRMVSEKKYDLALVDLVLPGGMNGIDIIRKLRGISKDIRIIAFTGFSGYNIAEKTARAGANDFLTKPFFTDQLINYIQKWLSSNNSPDPEKKTEIPAEEEPKKAKEFLPKVLFGFPRSAVDKILKIAAKEKLIPGTKIEINCHTELAIIFSGHAKCWYNGQIVNSLGPGESVGEASIFLKKGQNYDLILEAEDACEIYIISKERLKSYFANEHPSLFLRFSANIILNLSQKLFDCYGELAKSKGRASLKTEKAY